MTHCGQYFNSATIYPIPEKLLTIIRVMHDQSTAAIRAYGKTSEEFAVTSGVHQGCVLDPTLFNMFFDAVIRMTIDNHLEEGRVGASRIPP